MFVLYYILNTFLMCLGKSQGWIVKVVSHRHLNYALKKTNSWTSPLFSIMYSNAEAHTGKHNCCLSVLAGTKKERICQPCWSSFISYPPLIMLALAFYDVGHLLYFIWPNTTKNTHKVTEGERLNGLLRCRASSHLPFTSLHFVEIPTNRLDLLFNKS